MTIFFVYKLLTPLIKMFKNQFKIKWKWKFIKKSLNKIKNLIEICV